MPLTLQGKPASELQLIIEGAEPQLIYPISVKDYLELKQLADSFICDVLSVIRPLGYQIYDAFVGLNGQIPCSGMSPALMNRLLSYQPVAKTCLGVGLLILQNSEQEEQHTAEELQSDRNLKN